MSEKNEKINYITELNKLTKIIGIANINNINITDKMSVCANILEIIQYINTIDTIDKTKISHNFFNQLFVCLNFCIKDFNDKDKELLKEEIIKLIDNKGIRNEDVEDFFLHLYPFINLNEKETIQNNDKKKLIEKIFQYKKLNENKEQLYNELKELNQNEIPFDTDYYYYIHFNKKEHEKMNQPTEKNNKILFQNDIEKFNENITNINNNQNEIKKNQDEIQKNQVKIVVNKNQINKTNTEKKVDEYITNFNTQINNNNTEIKKNTKSINRINFENQRNKQKQIKTIETEIEKIQNKTKEFKIIIQYLELYKNNNINDNTQINNDNAKQYILKEFIPEIKKYEEEIDNIISNYRNEIFDIETKNKENELEINKLNENNKILNTNNDKFKKENKKILDKIKQILNDKQTIVKNFLTTNKLVGNINDIIAEYEKIKQQKEEIDKHEIWKAEAKAKEAEAKAKEAEDTTNYYTPTVKSKTVNEDKDYMYQTDTKAKPEEHKLKPEPTNNNIIPTFISFKENPDIVPITEPTPRNNEDTKPGNYNPNIYKHPNQNNDSGKSNASTITLISPRKKPVVPPLVLSKNIKNDNNNTPEYSLRFHDSDNENETNRTETTDINRTFPDNIKTDNNSVDSAKDTIPSPRNENPEIFIIKNTTEIIKQLGIVKNKDFIQTLITSLNEDLNKNIRSAISNITTTNNDEKIILECLKFIFLFVENDKWCNKNGQKVNVITEYMCSQDLNDTDLTTHKSFELYQEEQNKNYYTIINDETYNFENFGINKIEPPPETLTKIYTTIPV